MSDFNVRIKNPNGEPIEFSRLDVLRKWLEAEVDGWSWLQHVNQQDKRNLERWFVNNVQSVARIAMALEAEPTNEALSKELQQSIEIINNSIDEDKYINSSSTLGTYLRSVADGNPELAAAALRIYVTPNSTNSDSTPHLLKGAAVLAAFELGISQKSATSSVRSVKKTESELQSLLLEYTQSFSTELESFENTNASTVETIQELGDLFRSALEKHRDTLDKERLRVRKAAAEHLEKLVGETKTTLADVREFYKK